MTVRRVNPHGRSDQKEGRESLSQDSLPFRRPGYTTLAGGDSGHLGLMLFKPTDHRHR
jgi:hypothetical protein